MATGMTDKIAVVTGAGRGIGAAIAQRLHAEGAKVVFVDIDIEPAREAVAGLGDGALAVHVDITRADSLAMLATTVRERYGRCDILVNNAAILDMTPFSKLTMEHLRHVAEVNLNGAIGCTLALAPLMQGRGWGRILNIASIMGVRGSQSSIPYSTAKGGIVNFTRALACDLAAEGILVNAIAPGFIDTRMALLPDGSGHEHETDWFKDIYLKYGRIPLGRAGTPEDLAGPAFFLCSDDCRYITGQILMVDGGVSATF